MRLLLPFGLAFASATGSLYAQFPANTNATYQIPSAEVIGKAQKKNVLTYEGKPFHAVLDIQEQKSDPAYTGRVELSWVNTTKYRLVVHSPSFTQELIVNGNLVQETNKGDFYPNWLHEFVLALMDPMPRAAQILETSKSVTFGSPYQTCAARNDRPGGITDQMTWGSICFSGPDHYLEFVMDFTYNMEFHDYAGFGKKQVARTYISGEGERARLVGKVTTLEELKNIEEASFAVLNLTPKSDRILTTFISTTDEEARVETKPDSASIKWPIIPEGKVDGYMIVNAVTDRTGQVRETSKYDSDNPGLEAYGRLVALQYKFKPLVVDGVLQQMQMPLVLHFTTKLGNFLPEFDDVQSRGMIVNCDVPHEIPDAASSGQKIVITFQVADDGKLMTLGSSDRKIPIPLLFSRFSSCSYKLVQRNGQATAYHLNVTMTAR